MISTVKTKIKEKLDGLTGAGQPIAYVYDHYTKNVDGYPCVMFEPTSVPDSAIEDTQYNLRQYAFELLLIQEISTTDRDVAIDNIASTMDSILNAFDSDYTLGGTCTGGVNPVPGDFGQWDMETWPVIMATIRLVCKVLIDIM